MSIEIQKYIKKKKDFYNFLLEFIDNDLDSNNAFQNFINYIDTQNIKENQKEFKEFLCLISIISRNHHRSPQFFNKIEEIIKYLEEDIKQTFSNSSIVNIFKKNKRILLFLLETQIIKIDEFILDFFTKPSNRLYFYKAIKSSIDLEMREEIENELSKIDETIFDNFEEKCQIGENDSYICSLIRNDSVEQFVAYVNKHNIKLSSKIKSSIFETHSFLLKNKPTLIEYAAFYGSIQIFQYLELNRVKLTSSLWLYAIHGRNPDLIHLLEENHVDPEDDSYEKYLKESIKCHHNEIASYIQNSLLSKKIDRDDESHLLLLDDNVSNDLNNFKENIEYYSFHYLNFEFFPDDFKSNEFIIFYLCQFNYVTIVDIFLNTETINLSKKIVLLSLFSLFIGLYLNDVNVIQTHFFFSNGIFDQIFNLLCFFIFCLNDVHNIKIYEIQ